MLPIPASLLLTHAPRSCPALSPPSQASEEFLQRMMSLYVASHYKNTPNDLLLMSDAPAHQLYVLLGPVDQTKVRSVWRWAVGQALLSA